MSATSRPGDDGDLSRAGRSGNTGPGAGGDTTPNAGNTDTGASPGTTSDPGTIGNAGTASAAGARVAPGDAAEAAERARPMIAGAGATVGQVGRHLGRERGHGWQDPTPDEAIGGAHDAPNTTTRHPVGTTASAAATPAAPATTATAGARAERDRQPGPRDTGTTASADATAGARAERDRQPGPRGTGTTAPAAATPTTPATASTARAQAERDRRPGPRGMGHVGEPASWPWMPWLRRTSAALLATLVLGTGLVWAWVGGLHAPYPRNVPVAVVDGDLPANALLAQVAGRTDSLAAVRYADPDDATAALSTRRVAGILATDAEWSQGVGLIGGLNLTIAGGAGPGVADAVAGAVTAAASELGIPLAIEDTHPVSAGDAAGRTPFYLMMSWVLGGLLAAVILGIALGTVPRDLDRLGMRLAALAVFSLVLGLFGALLAGPILDVWHRHTFGLWLAGSLIIFTAALITSALQSWLGMWGVGVAVLLMVVLGLPGSGGLFGSDLLPGFFRGMHTWLPNGQGTDLIRGLEYFGRAANTWPIVGLGLWSVASILALFAATAVLGRHAREKAWAVAWERDDDPAVSVPSTP